jgi:hypothetical protein
VGYRSRRISTSRSTKSHSSVARSMASSSSNPASSAGANSNHVKKSKGSPRSRLWCKRRATAGRYFRPVAICPDRSSRIARRSSWDSAHHSSDFLIGISAALLASGRPRLGEAAVSSLCSRAWTYRSCPITPTSVQVAPGGPTRTPSRTANRSTAGTDTPATADTLRTRQLPAVPPANTTGTTGMQGKLPDRAGSGSAPTPTRPTKSNELLPSNCAHWR